MQMPWSNAILHIRRKMISCALSGCIIGSNYNHVIRHFIIRYGAKRIAANV